MLSPVRLSVTQVYHTKAVEVRIMKFLWGKFHLEILRDSPESGVKQGGGKISHFLDLSVNISKTVVGVTKVAVND